MCGIVESGAVSKADREEESSPDGEADGAGSDAFGEGQAKDSKAHAVDNYILRERNPSFHIVIGLRITNICCEWTDGSAPITQYMCRIQVTLRAAAYSADVHVWEVSSGKLWEVG